MYETEANNMLESKDQIPAEVLERFSGMHGRVLSRTALPWSEHCTECVWPTCYTTCDLYSPRQDGRCRRFVDGMVRVEYPSALNGYLLKIRFKQWAKLWTPGNLKMLSCEQARRLERRDFHFGSVLYKIPLPSPIKTFVTSKRYGWKKRQASRTSKIAERPTSLMLECFNPSSQGVDLSLTVRSSKPGQMVPFQMLMILKPGFNSIRCSFLEMETVIDFDYPFQLELIPNSVAEEITLYFGLMDFVDEVAALRDVSGGIKCVVWDLDHTLWHGVLIEDGPEKLKLKRGIKDLIEELDRRGILQSVASKNNFDDAMAALSALGLQEYFLYPQIGWAPKGEGLKAIASQLNIGIDSILFIDDQAFEREEVEASCRGVRTMDAADYSRISTMDEFQVPVTEESQSRRAMYQTERERQEIQRSFRDDYKAFLKNCDIRLTVSSLTEDNLERVHELTQRTNQMNFSGNRYDRTVLRGMLRSDVLDTYVLRCKDRFGTYGIVGFGVVDRQEPRLIDLMFSCRIQAKRVEHAFLRTIIAHYLRTMERDFHANYRKTAKNAPSGAVFNDLGMVEEGSQDGVTSLIFIRNGVLPDDGIITVMMQDIALTVR